MSEQKRWFCAACGREWLDVIAPGAMPWNPEGGCRGCRSMEIKLVVYKPDFPGGDIARQPMIDTVQELIDALTVTEQAAPLTLVAADQTPQIDVWQFI